MLNSVNCSTVICLPTVEYLCSLEKPLVKPMAPGSLSHHINLHHFIIALLLLCFYFLLCISIPKIPKILFIISIRSHFRKWPWRDWQPLSMLVALSYCFCVGTWDSCVASYWIDTLVLKNWGKYLRYFAASSSPLRGNPTQCSRGSSLHYINELELVLCHPRLWLLHDEPHPA